MISILLRVKLRNDQPAKFEAKLVNVGLSTLIFVLSKLFLLIVYQYFIQLCLIVTV